jgi:tetratricopeptide (TPR) repeat protein
MAASQAVVPALGSIWLQRLAQRCTQEGVALPGGQALHEKLAQPDAPPSARGRMAQLMHAEWVKGRNEVPPWQMQAVVEAIEGWWHALPPEGDALGTGLDAGLAPAWVRAQGALGHVEPLAEAVQRWQLRLGKPAHEAEALALLRQLRRLKGEASIEPSLLLVEALGARWEPGAPWTGEIVGSLAMVSRISENFAPLVRAVPWLERLAPHAARADAEPWRAPLTAAAARCASLPVLHQMAEALLANAQHPDPGMALALAGAVEAMAVLAPAAAGTRAVIERAAKAFPWQPTIQLEQAKQLRAGGALVQELAGPLQALDPAHPATPAAWQLLAEYAFHDGQLEIAQQCYERLEALGQLDEQSQLRRAHLSLQQGHAAAAGYEPGMVLPEAGPQRLDPEHLGPLAPALSKLDTLLEVPLRHDGPLDVAQLEKRGALALAAFERALPGLRELTLADIGTAASHLWERANSGALDLAHWEGVFPFDVGPAFGTLDGYRCRAVCRSLLDHLVALCRHATQRERPLRGAPGDASVAMLLELLGQQLDAQLALKKANEALADLGVAAERFGGLGEGAMQVLRQRAQLAVGDIAAVNAELAAVPGAKPDAPRSPEALGSLDWAAWLAAEGVSDHPLVQDPACPGRFEVVDVLGRVRTEQHAAVATSLSLARMTDLRVRNVHLLVGDKGGILRPHPWHVQMADFPYPHPNVVARGAQGAILRRAGLWRRLEEPLLVLANMDAPYHRNYYHWMVLALTRIQTLMAHGMLKTRKLLLPKELTGWMISSLRDIGLDDARIRWYGAHDDLRLTDALVASPTEFASPTLVENLRRGLTQAAGLDPDKLPPPTRLIYLARRGETRRPMVEAEQVITIAEELGFEIVAAETLSLLDQVRLFATARGIAGPPGAAFTNLMWAPAGTRVLTIFKQDINGPTFLDLSFLRQQRHRWLQARSIAGFEGVSVVTSPFSVDLHLARRELQWVRDGDPA